MIKQYGDIQFNDGFKIIEDNYQDLIDEDDCEEKLAALIEDLNFDSPEYSKSQETYVLVFHILC